MPTKCINTSLPQLKQYADALEDSIASTQSIIDDFELDEESHAYKHMLTLQGILGYIKQDVEYVERYEQEIEEYRKQLEMEEDI